MATSGTVSTTVFETRKVIEHAFRKMRMVPAQITSEYVEVAQDLLYLILSGLSSDGIKLWNIEKNILGLYRGEQSLLTPVGTIEVLDITLRTGTRQISDTLLASAGEALPTEAFDDALSSTYTQVAPLGWAGLQTDSDISPYTFGFFWRGLTGTWSFIWEVSTDGIAWSSVGPPNKTNQYIDLAVEFNQWIWIDAEGTPDAASFFRLRALDPVTVMSVGAIVIQTNPTEINLAQINRNDYANLPTKNNRGRPTQYWYDRQRVNPVVTLWPAPDDAHKWAQAVIYRQRQIQDVGTLTQELELPQRWYLAVVYELSKMLITEIKEADLNLLPVVSTEADVAMRKAWDGESDGSDASFVVMIRPYTA